MNRDTFCIYPWITVYLERNGDYTTCGHAWQELKGKDNIYEKDVKEAWNGDYFKKVRSELLSGIKSENCKVCWYKEEKGMTSPRQEYNKDYSHLKIDFEEEIDNSPLILGLKSDNTCNLKCITCKLRVIIVTGVPIS